MSPNTQVQVKKRKAYSCFLSGNNLIVERLSIEEDYSISIETGRPTNQLVDTRRKMVKQYVLNKMSVEDVKQWRSKTDMGIIFVKNGQLYTRALNSRELKDFYSFLRGAVHLCGTSKLCCTAPAGGNPKDFCPYILSISCTNIERYVEFIKDGYELFSTGQNHSVIYVCSCTRIRL